jgi:hypothetical protein
VRKRLITPIPQDASSLDEGWLDLDGAAVVEVTSEEKEYPVEAALVQEKCGAGVPQILAHKPFDWSSTNRKS